MEANSSKTVLAFGGGVDSTALLAMHLNRPVAALILGISLEELNAKLPHFDAVVFSDPGAEFPQTYDNIETARGLCAEAGLHFETVKRDGETITEWVTRLGIVPLMAGGSHVCSLKFKGEVLAKWASESYGEPVRWAIGIEADEGHRVSRFKAKANTDSVFPLVDLGLDRKQAEDILAKLWPVPVRKSSCVFCPFMSEGEINDLAKCGESFEIAAKVEANFKATSKVKHAKWITAGEPLNKGGRAPVGMWRKDSYADGARLFAKKINGKQLSVAEWRERAIA